MCTSTATFYHATTCAAVFVDGDDDDDFNEKICPIDVTKDSSNVHLCMCTRPEYEQQETRAKILNVKNIVHEQKAHTVKKKRERDGYSIHR